MRNVIPLIILSLNLNAQADVTYKTYPEFTDEAKVMLPTQMLGIKTDPDKEMSSQTNLAKGFLRSLHLSVLQLHAGCGAVLTSNDGYAITALHCLEAPGQISPVNHQSIAVSENGEEVTANVAKQEMVGHQYVNWPFNPARNPKFEELLPLEIVSLGKGYPDIKRKWTTTDASLLQHLDVIKSHMDDYAVIKLKNIPENHSCIKIKENPRLQGELSWTAGYPVNTKAKQVYVTEQTLDTLINKANFLFSELSPYLRRAKSKLREQLGESWLLSETNRQQSPFYVAVGRGFRDYKSLNESFSYPRENNLDQVFDLITDSKKYLVSSSFVKPGFSGGGIFNTSGELLGINSMAPDAPIFLADKFQPLMSHVRADYIKKQVEKKLGIEMANKIFNCSN